MSLDHLSEEKFINPRNLEGVLQTERLKYIRDFFEYFAENEKNLVGACVVGSTVKGYGEDKSDIDTAVFYYQDIPEGENGPSIDRLFRIKFADNARQFKAEAEKEEKSAFIIDGQDFFNIRLFLERNDKDELVLRRDAKKHWVNIITTLCFPSIENKYNSDFQIPEFKQVVRNTIRGLSNDEKDDLYRELVSLMRNMATNEQARVENRTDDYAFSYSDDREDAFRAKLKREFDLESENKF